MNSTPLVSLDLTESDPTIRQLDLSTDQLIDLVTKPGQFAVQVQTVSDDSWSGNGKVFDHWLEAYV